MASLLPKLGEWFGKHAWIAVLWLTSPANRARLRGARVEVVVCVVSRQPRPSVLLVRSSYGPWMPFQEGVHMRETFEQACFRCLREEGSLSIPDDAALRRRRFWLRRIRYLDTLQLPRERWGERDVADDVADTPMAAIEMHRKAYWGAVIVVAGQQDASAIPNRREIDEVQWTTFDAARGLVRDTNRPDKAGLLIQALALAEHQLTGMHVAAERGVKRRGIFHDLEDEPPNDARRS